MEREEIKSLRQKSYYFLGKFCIIKEGFENRLCVGELYGLKEKGELYETKNVGVLLAGMLVVASTQETSSVITEVSQRLKEVKQSAGNLRTTADVLEQNMKNLRCKGNNSL